MAQHTQPADIERASMAIITEELSARGIVVPQEHAAVVLRVIHATADFDYAENLHFTPDAVRLGVEALAGGAPIVTDTNMALAGVSKQGLEKFSSSAYCYMADPVIAALARAHSITRAAASMLYAAECHPGAVFAIGNAPTALLTFFCLFGVRRACNRRYGAQGRQRRSGGHLQCAALYCRRDARPRRARLNPTEIRSVFVKWPRPPVTHCPYPVLWRRPGARGQSHRKACRPHRGSADGFAAKMERTETGAGLSNPVPRFRQRNGGGKNPDSQGLESGDFFAPRAKKYYSSLDRLDRWNGVKCGLFSPGRCAYT